MIAPDESLREVRSMKSSLLGPKHTLRVGAWNVGTMYEPSKSAQVIKEMTRYRLDILGVSESRWIGSGRQVTQNGSVILYSGHESKHVNGVAFIFAKENVNSLLEWEQISERMIRARFHSKHCKLTVIHTYWGRQWCGIIHYH